jgi:hypothetical protein
MLGEMPVVSKSMMAMEDMDGVAAGIQENGFKLIRRPFQQRPL